LTLKVFSSMQIYRVAPEADQAQFGNLYEKCRQTEGVELIGSIPQPQLAAAMRSVTAFTYPNTFPETCCIAAMEAMAAGCCLVTSDLAALPQTTAGFARLIPVGGALVEYENDFAAQTLSALGSFQSSESALRRQVEHANAHYTCENQAKRW